MQDSIRTFVLFIHHYLSSVINEVETLNRSVYGNVSVIEFICENVI